MEATPAREAAIEAWREAFGAVDDRSVTLDRYARTTQPHGTRPCCVLYPQSAEDVQAAVRIAAAYGVPLYPISRGKNWGYGDACAPQAGAAIVDLSNMNRILEIDGELGYAVIEPGVTQQQLYEAVQREAPGFWLDCTGAGREASVVGNALERGFGHTPYGDHVRSTCGIKAVLADGRILRTGLYHYENAPAAPVYPYGLGPYLDGLFTQSNFGIVIRLGLWLYPKPEAFRFFFIKLEGEDALAPLVDALRPLRLGGVLNSAVHIGNDLRIISSLRRYPWEEAGGKTPLPEALRAQLRQETGVGAWNVSGALTGTAGHMKSAVKALRRAAGPLGKVVFVDDRKLALGRRAVGILRRIGLGGRLATQLEGLAPNYGLLQGIPTDEPLRGTQWRLRESAPGSADPLDQGCGLSWLSPVVPLRGSDAQRVVATVAPVFARHGFELLATFTMLNERAMVSILNMAYDKSVPEETEAAAACYEEASLALKAAAYPPYRTSPAGMRYWMDKDDSFWTVVHDLKHALDPNSILAPGRYAPPE